jgi:DNA polymerase-1
MKTLTIDGNNLIHRVFWICKLKSDIDSAGLLHVQMFINSIKKYTEMFKPDKTFVCWDEKPDQQPNIRHSLNSNYKGNRDKETAGEVYAQTGVIKTLVESLGIKNLFPYRYEADDIMCYIARKIPGHHTIVTVDKDLYQLVNSNVTVFNPIKKVEITDVNFTDVVGCTIDQFVTIKALKGDNSDNIAGLKGFGDKKIKRYLDGEVTLDDEQKLIVEQNLKIMDLLQGGVSCPVEIEYISNQLSTHPEPNFKNFIDVCKELKFESIVNSKDKWNEMFFFKNAYTSLLTNLFS